MSHQSDMSTVSSVATNPRMAHRIYYRADLALESALHVGNPGAEAPFGTTPCRLDSHGVPYLPGSSLAGRWIATADRLFSDFRSKAEFLTGKFQPRSRTKVSKSSRLSVRSAYPLSRDGNGLASSAEQLHPALLTPRDRVAVDPALGTARDEMKFSQWEVSTGARFRLLMELDLEDWGSAKLEPKERDLWISNVETVLGQWSLFGRLGGHSGVGNGWFRICNVERFELCAESLDRFLNMRDLRTDAPPGAWSRIHPETRLASVSKDLRPLGFQIKAIAGPDASGFGWNSILIRGGEFWQHQTGMDAPSIRRRRIEWGTPSTMEEFYVPGSSVRGAVKALMRKLPRGDSDSDRSTHRQGLLALFGEAAGEGRGRAGCALFGDLAADSSVTSILFHRHAEDEFTAGVLGTQLFDEESLVEGAVGGWVICDSARAEDRAWFKALRDALAQAAQCGLLSIGAGGSTPQWTISELRDGNTVALGAREGIGA